MGPGAVVCTDALAKELVVVLVSESSQGFEQIVRGDAEVGSCVLVGDLEESLAKELLEGCGLGDHYAAS